MIIGIIVFIIYVVYTILYVSKFVDFLAFILFNDLFLFPLVVLFIHTFEIFSYVSCWDIDNDFMCVYQFIIIQCHLSVGCILPLFSISVSFRVNFD